MKKRKKGRMWVAVDKDGDGWVAFSEPKPGQGPYGCGWEIEELYGSGWDNMMVCGGWLGRILGERPVPGRLYEIDWSCTKYWEAT